MPLSDTLHLRRMRIITKGLSISSERSLLGPAGYTTKGVFIGFGDSAINFELRA